MRIIAIISGVFACIVIFSIITSSKWFEWLEEEWDKRQVLIGSMGFMALLGGLFAGKEDSHNADIFVIVGGWIFISTLLSLLAQIAYNTSSKNQP